MAEAGGQAILTGGSVTTNGNSAYGVVAHGGGFVQLNGTSINTMGDGSGGLAINGAGSEIDATNVTISTIGGSDSSTGPLQHSYGVYNGPFGSFAAGGVARLTDTSVSTQSDQMHGVNTSTGGSTTILGGSITTAGFDANAIYTAERRDHDRRCERSGSDDDSHHRQRRLRRRRGLRRLREPDRIADIDCPGDCRIGRNSSP